MPLKHFNMITSYKEMNIATYEKLRRIQTDEDGFEELDLQTQILAILNDATVDDMLNLTLNDYQKMVRKSRFMLEPPKGKSRIHKRIRLGGKRYDITTDITKFLTAQYVDYMTLSQLGDIDDHIVDYLAILIIPRGKSYGEGYDMEEVKKAIREEMDIETALDVCFFFRKRSTLLIRGLVGYLKREMKRMIRKETNPEIREKLMENRNRLNQLTLLCRTLDSSIG